MTTPLLRQTWTISAVLINMFGLALVLSYPTSLLPALNHPDSSIKVDLHSSSWLGSIPSVAGVPGYLISSLLMALYGRKMTHELIMLPAVIGWIMIYFAKDIPTLMIGRFLCGLTAMPAVSLGAVVIGEYTSPKYRGVFLNLKNVSVCLGVMCMHIISRYLHWKTIALISLIPLITALLITYTWCESPSWLASKNKYEKSQESFKWLRGDSEDARREIEDMIKDQEVKLSKSNMQFSIQDKIREFFQKFTRKDFLKPSLIMVLASIVVETSGKHIFPAYALHIITDITGETFQSFYYTLGIDIIITASAVFASFLVKMMNRRTLLFSTGFAAMLVLLIFCSYLALVSKYNISDSKPWIPIGLLVSYFILSNLGCVPIPLVLSGEIFPLAHREVSLAIYGVWLSICVLLALKSAPHLLLSIRAYGFFAVYGGILGICLVTLYFIMPETKDRTLQEIETHFNHGTFTVADNFDCESSTETLETITM